MSTTSNCQTGFTDKDANVTALQSKSGNFSNLRSNCAAVGNLTVLNNLRVCGEILDCDALLRSYGSLLYRDIAGTTFPIIVTPTIPITSNVPVKLPLNTATYPTTLGLNSGDFDMPEQARLRYIGTQSKVFNITIDMDGYNTSGLPIFYIAINGLAQLETSNVVTGAAPYLDRHLSLISTLSTNDYIEVFVSNGIAAPDAAVATNKLNICAIEI